MAKRKVACVGDSITLGAAQDNYPLFLQWLLGSDYDVGNFGIAGATMVYTTAAPYVTTPEYAASLRWIAQGGDVIICLGTNDTQAANWDEAAFMPDTLKLIASYYAAGASRVFLCLPPPATTIAPVNGALLVSGVLPRLGLAGPEGGARIIDLYSPLKNAYPNGPTDGVHPDRDGMLMMSEIIQPFITIARKILRPPTSPLTPSPVIEDMNYRWADPAGGGKEIIITGRNFLGSSIEIENLVIAPTLVTATEIRFDPPPHSEGVFLLRIKNSYGVYSEFFEYYSPGDTDFAKLFAEEPDYSVAGADGTWTARKGLDLISMAQPPLGALVAPADVAGTPDASATPSQGLRSQDQFGSLMWPSCGGAFFVFNLDATVPQSPDGSPFNDPALMSHPYTGAIGVGVSDAGVRGYVYKQDVAAYAVATAPGVLAGTGKHSATFRWANRRSDGLGMQLDGGDFVSAGMGTAGSINLTDLLQFMTSWNGAATIDGKLRAVVVYNCRCPNLIAEKNRRWSDQRFT